VGNAHPVKLPQVAVWKPCTQTPVLCEAPPLSVTAVLVSLVLVSVVLVSVALLAVSSAIPAEGTASNKAALRSRIRIVTSLSEPDGLFNGYQPFQGVSRAGVDRGRPNIPVAFASSSAFSRRQLTSLESNLAPVDPLFTEAAIELNSATRSVVELVVMVEVQVVPVVSEKNVDGVDAMLCIAVQAEMAMPVPVSVLQLEGVLPVGAP
jgi:hypothetical protein